MAPFRDEDILELDPNQDITKACNKCRRQFPISTHFVNRKGGPTSVCQKCRKSSNNSHKRRRQREAEERKQQQQQQQQQEQQQRQQLMEQKMAVQSQSIQQQHQHQQQNPFVAQTQSENASGYDIMDNRFNADSQNAFLSSYHPAPGHGLSPVGQDLEAPITANASMVQASPSQSRNLVFGTSFANGSSASQTGRNLQSSYSSNVHVNGYINHLNSLFVASNNGIQTEMPAMVPRIAADLQNLLEGDIPDLTSAMLFSEQDNRVRMQMFIDDQWQDYDVETRTQSFLHRAD